METTITFQIQATKIIHRGECGKEFETTLANAIRIALEDQNFDQLTIDVSRCEWEKEQ